ncbi:unnamed protein product [Cuscuta europaea]|uniref:Uncharacterized protein n=1 Tax=Cuscuta europaea TaxID=41803 RepID=A0A9P1DZB4_CUSEU|nr:unnamed protein product [Cuscuta europaea]
MIQRLGLFFHRGDLFIFVADGLSTRLRREERMKRFHRVGVVREVEVLLKAVDLFKNMDRDSLMKELKEDKEGWDPDILVDLFKNMDRELILSIQLWKSQIPPKVKVFFYQREWIVHKVVHHVC